MIVFALMAITLLMVDSRMQSLSAIRQMVGVVLFPLQSLALVPRDTAYAVGDYFVSLHSLQKENSALKREQVANGQALQAGQQLLAENAHLRKLLAAGERLPVKSVMSEILYDTRDAFSRKLVLDRGLSHGIVAGQPVIDDIGVVGQVTRVFPFTSEVTLLTDKNHAISVQVIRSGVRSVAYGRGQAGVMDLRFIAANADIQKGDVLVTSGIDGVYPAGLAVAKVTQVEHKSGDAFAGIVCQPTAGIDRHRQVLVLLTEARPMSPAIAVESGAGQKAAVKAASSQPVAKSAASPAAPAGKTGNAVIGGVGAATKAPVTLTSPVGAAKNISLAAPDNKPAPTAAVPVPAVKPGSMTPAASAQQPKVALRPAVPPQKVTPATAAAPPGVLQIPAIRPTPSAAAPTISAPGANP